MEQHVMSQNHHYIKKIRFRQSWHRLVALLSFIVVLGTVYAMMLPVITAEKQCPIPEHTHTDDCFTQRLSETITSPVCTPETMALHQHEAGCYGGDGKTLCGYADFVVHRHDDSCRRENGELWCPLPEIREHTHEDSCYVWPQVQAHVHGEACYQTERGELACGLHQHTEDCWTESVSLTCGLEEQDGHRHGEGCYSLEAEPSCGLEENEEHTHSDGCYARQTEPACGLEEKEGHRHGDNCHRISRELTCGIDGDHVHTDACFSTRQVLICPMEEAAGDISPEPELICNKEEIVCHTHEGSCFDGSSRLICGKTQILRHQHGEACFAEAQRPLDPQALTCALEESADHRHSGRCYGVWELCCGQQEHTHDERCVGPEPEETEPSVPEETSPAVPTGLPVFGTAHAGPELSGRMAGVYALSSAAGARSSAVNVEGYVSGARLEYQTEDGQWLEATQGADIPGDAAFRLTVLYAGVPIDSLLQAECTMTYTLPEIFRDAQAEGVIEDAAKQQIGTITASGSTATVVFDREWLNSQNTGANTVVSGDFYVMGRVNLTRIPGGGETTIQIGDVTLTVNFAGDLLARYGDVRIAKTVQPSVAEAADGDYLMYTLTVTAGQDGCPEVSVEDVFEVGSQNIARDEAGLPLITVLSPEDARVTINENGMTWTIGDMAPGSTRELSYRVKLAQGYTGIAPNASRHRIRNAATVRSKDYERDSDAAVYEPRGAGTLSKIGVKADTDENGCILITYYVWVKALDDNSYTLDNVKLFDSLDGTSMRNPRPTDPEVRRYLSYQEDSFRLYSGGSNRQNSLDGLTELEMPQGALVWGGDTNGDGSQSNDSFTFYFGDMAPGESRTLVYQVRLTPGMYAGAGNEDVEIINRAEIISDDSRADGNQWLNGYYAEFSFGRKAWSRKTVGTALEQMETVTMSGKVYDPDGALLQNPGSFIVPAGSYRYQVVVNEAGDWDLSSASLTDTLGPYLRFVGYVRIDAYDIDGDAPASGLQDSEALAYFQDKTPARTFWIPVDGEQSFTVSPSSFGAEQNQAFRMTYYARPVNTEGLAQVVVDNAFDISGTVGYGPYTYELARIRSGVEVVVSGSNSFHAEKQAWYYEPAKVTSGDFKNGAFYWVLKVDGSLIPRGTAIKDVTNQSGGTTHYIRGTSLAGVYTGNLGAGGITVYPDFGALTGSGKLTALDTSRYTVGKANEWLSITLTEELPLESGDSLYVIVKTEPNVIPRSDRDMYTYNNKLQSSYEGGSWMDHNVASTALYGSENIFKELGRIFTYSGTQINTVTGGTNADIHTGHLTGPGTYVAWQIHLNYEGALSGTYRLVEQIPEGMEVAYIRTYWLGSKAVTQNPLPATVPIEDLGPEWTAYEKTMSSRNSRDYTTHYYINGQQVLLEYQNLFPGGEKDMHAVEIQVVCKLTDQEVLMGGVTRDYNNVARLLTPEGEEVGSDTHGVTLSYPSMSKSKDNTATVSGGKYPFVIQLNPQGADLMPGADTITLVDELGENLIISTSSIRVRNTATGAELTENWQASVELDADGTQTMKIILPDGLPLTVSYEAAVNAAPGEKVTVTNDAHWEGYASAPGSSVEDSEYSYEVGGTAGASGTPRILVHKIDQYNTRLSLPGAEFSLTEMVLQGDTLTAKTGGLSQSGTTGEDGMLTFGTETEQLLAYNTVYRLQETRAPQGYVLDSTPHYVLVAQKENGVYPDYSGYREAGVYIYYGGSDYTYEAKNHRGEISVEKRFADAGGNPVSSLDGTYRFGLFTDREGTQKVQETYAVFADGQQTAAARFTNVELNKAYYVYELDDRRLPIINGRGNVGGIPFAVSSSQESVLLSAEEPAVTVTVTNRMDYAELPHTGGSSAVPCGILGALLMIAALYLMYHHHKRRGEGFASV